MTTSQAARHLCLETRADVSWLNCSAFYLEETYVFSSFFMIFDICRGGI
jgi:hypothetical protein